MTKDRKYRRKRTLRRLLLGIILVFLLLFFLGDRWGIGPGDLLRLTSSDQEQESESNGTQTSYREVLIRVSESTIQVNETVHTIDSLETSLNEAEADTLFVLIDQQANYALFTRIESMLQERELMYVIED
jgi:biopolymer transport protein ExbD